MWGFFAAAIHLCGILISVRIPVPVGEMLSKALLPVISRFWSELTLHEEFSVMRNAITPSLFMRMGCGILLMSDRHLRPPAPLPAAFFLSPGSGTCLKPCAILL